MKKAVNILIDIEMETKAIEASQSLIEMQDIEERLEKQYHDAETFLSLWTKRRGFLVEEMCELISRNIRFREILKDAVPKGKDPSVWLSMSPAQWAELIGPYYGNIALESLRCKAQEECYNNEFYAIAEAIEYLDGYLHDHGDDNQDSVDIPF